MPFQVTDETSKPLTFIDECIDQISQASRRDPIDWVAIRAVAIRIETEARTEEQKVAADKLKRASDVTRVSMALGAIQRAFLQGKPDADGWPRRF
jgi:hypothetical protein